MNDHTPEMHNPYLKHTLKLVRQPSFSMRWVVNLFSRRWLLATILVICAAAVMMRLGFWQMDRLEQRRAFNTRVLAQISQPALDLNQTELPPGLIDMEYRSAFVRGSYDHSAQVVLVNQAWENRIGVHLLTPLRIEGSDQVVLVDRGWVPTPDFNYSGDWSQFDEPGLVTVRGVLRAGQTGPSYGPQRDDPAAGAERRAAWYFPDLERIMAQLPYQIIPMYLQQAPQEAAVKLPYRSQPDLEITEGPHFGYALQWFGFALLLLVGYPFFVQRREREHSLPD